jgi:hypothetical protein
MGSQVNFFMVPEDEEAFCRFVLGDPAVTILRAHHLEQPHVPVSLPLPPANEPDCWALVLWNRNVATRDQVMPRGRHRDPRNPAGRYVVSAIANPVIDFDRSVPRLNGLAPGRIWAEFNRYDVPEDRLKIARAWFQRLARWLNKWPYRWDIYRIGPKTKEYLDKGGTFINFVAGETISITEVGTNRVIERGVRQEVFRPKVVRDDGEADLTVEIGPE